MSDIGAAVIGTGFIGPVHVEALRRAGVHVVGVLGSSAGKSQAAAAKMTIPKAYASLDELLADGEVQVVHIATPNWVHYEQAGAALAAGKHVMCEKPLAMDSWESARLVELAAEAGLAAGVNYSIRYYPLNLEARDIVERGDLGQVYSVCGSYVQDWLLYATDYNWRVLADAGGELRAVADIGTHWLDLTQAITGLEVRAVCADLSTVHPLRQRPKGEVETFKGKEGPLAETEPIAITTEDYGCVLLRLSGGARGCVWVSQVTAGRKNCLRYEIAGSKATLAWCSEQPNELWIGHRDGPNECLIRDPALVSAASGAFIDYPGGHNEGFADTFKQLYRAFYGYIAAEDFAAPAPFPTFRDGHREILLCEAILRSHRDGGWVAVEA